MYIFADARISQIGNGFGYFGSILVPSNAYDCNTMPYSHVLSEYDTHNAKPGDAIPFM